MAPAIRAPRGAAVRAQRFVIHLPVRYRIAGSPSWQSGTTANISASGVLFSAEQPLAVNTAIDLVITLPDTGRSAVSGEVVGRARIVRVAASAPRLVAAAFADLAFGDDALRQ